MLGATSRRPVCSRCQAALVQQTQQTRHATLIKRPKRPYTFTQLITLSDGSTFLHRTTSPAAVYKSTKDTKNHFLWNPSSQKLMNTEDDDAGRLKQFRLRFGRGWDSEATEQDEGDETDGVTDSLADLMAAAADEEAKKQPKKAAKSTPEATPAPASKKK